VVNKQIRQFNTSFEASNSNKAWIETVNALW